MTDVQRQIEQEIVEKFWTLDPAARRRVLDQLTALQQPDKNWVDNLRALRERIHQENGKPVISIEEIIHEMREERLHDLLDRD
jgi:hypothetical protein